MSLLFIFLLFITFSIQEKSAAQLDPSVLSEKLAWQKEKVALHAALHKAEDDLVKATARNENRPITDLSNNKVIP